MNFLKKILQFIQTFCKREIRQYGWKPQKPDSRDFKYGEIKPISEVITTLPISVDLRSKLPPCWNQGATNSCTAHGIAAALVFDEQSENEAFVMPSRLFIYWNERFIESDVNEDGGAVIRDGIKAVATYGYADERIWPFDPTKVITKPPIQAYTCGLQHKLLQYMALDNTKLSELKGCLAAGFPFVFGFTVYDSFESQAVASTGLLPMPKPGEQVKGGHCVICVGFDDATKMFLIRNSWGVEWGQGGHFWMPYDFMTNPDLTSDLWTLRKVM